MLYEFEAGFLNLAFFVIALQNNHKAVTMRKNNVKRTAGSQKAADVMQQISSEGIVNNGMMSTVSDGSVRTVSDSKFDEYEERIMSETQENFDLQEDEWKRKAEYIKEVENQIKKNLETIDIRPWGIYILVKPFDVNPFSRMTRTEDGLIIPEFDPHYKSQDTGEYEEMRKTSIFACVVEISPDTRGIKPGDIVMYNQFESVPIPFYGQGFEVVAQTHIKCVIGNGEELSRRWLELSQKNNK